MGSRLATEAAATEHLARREKDKTRDNSMVRVRKLVLAIAAASALTSGMAHALGLGEVTLNSALNQPLDAEISLVEVGDLASNELIPKLASPEEFNKAGVDRQYFLTDLKFTPVLKPNGKSVIRVTSSKPVREPYLNFLVEVLWPNGRLLREYTLLLDPPLYSPETAVAAAPQLPVAAPAPRPVARAATPAASAPVVRPSAPVAPAALQGNEYRTTSSDTLWQIAERVRSSGTVHQTMLAIQDLNPDAFVNGNINRLKNGQVLRLPDAQQVASRSQSEAIAQVAAQNAAWREGRSLPSGSARQLDATKRSTAGAAPAQAESKDSLKLVSGETGKAAKGASGDSKALNDKLAVTQESLDTTRRENDELKSRMGDLQGQLDKLQRLIQLKDEQLAKLQADLASKGQAKPADAAPVAPAVAVAPVEAPQADAPSTSAQAQQPAAPAEQPDYNYSEEPAAPASVEPPQQNLPASASSTTDAAPAQESKPAAAPAGEEPPRASFFDDVMANPMFLWLAGGSALVLLLILLMVVSRRNAQKENELQNSLASQHDDNEFAGDIDLPESDFADLESVEPVAQPSVERVTAQTSDALGEADIYIAYGRFNQAAELLQNAINDEPHRSDLRLKLMEVQAELGDRDGFARQESELREIGGAAGEVELLKSRYPAMVAAAAAVGIAAYSASTAGSDSQDDELDFADLALDEPSSEVSAAEDVEFDLSLDDLASDGDSEPGRDDALAGFELDDLATEVPAASQVDPDKTFDLSLDDLADVGAVDDLADFSLDDASETKVPAEDEFLLSLDEAEEASESVGDELTDLAFELPEVTASTDLPADFDLSLDEESPVADVEPDFAAQLEAASIGLDTDLLGGDDLKEAAGDSAELDAEDDFDFLSGTDETATKLDLARAYIDMGDTEGARDILDEVLAEGSDGQQQEARELIARLA